MKKFIMAAIAAGTALAALSPAQAAGGCGPGFHPGPYGHRCFPNGGPGYARGPGPVIGTYYSGRGYWDGHRYWHHRDRGPGGWRYR